MLSLVPQGARAAQRCRSQGQAMPSPWRSPPAPALIPPACAARQKSGPARQAPERAACRSLPWHGGHETCPGPPCLAGTASRAAGRSPPPVSFPKGRSLVGQSGSGTPRPGESLVAKPPENRPAGGPPARACLPAVAREPGGVCLAWWGQLRRSARAGVAKPYRTWQAGTGKPVSSCGRAGGPLGPARTRRRSSRPQGRPLPERAGTERMEPPARLAGMGPPERASCVAGRGWPPLGPVGTGRLHGPPGEGLLTPRGRVMADPRLAHQPTDGLV